MPLVLTLLALLSCVHRGGDLSPPPSESPVTENPLLRPSPLPHEYPRFDLLQDAHFRPAFDAGMAEQRREMAAIAADPAPPTFENTLVAMERSGATLTRVSRAFSNLTSSDTNDVLQALEQEIAPRIAAHTDAITLDGALFARVDGLYTRRASLGLDPESLQLLERYHAMFVRAGARLGDAEKARLKTLNAELAVANTQFHQNAYKAMKEGGVVVDDVAELEGLSEGEIAAAAEAAASRGLAGRWVITLQNTTTQPPLAALKRRALRERIFLASTRRGVGGPADNTALVARIVELRAQRAALLGYPDFASYALAEETAGTPEAVTAMLAQVGAYAVKKAREEAAALQSIADAEARAAGTTPFPIQPWDWQYYAELDRKARFSFDEAEVKPYFELERVLKDGVFYSATQLYGITFAERTDLPVYHPSVRVFDVTNADGSPVGILLLDYFQRESKQGGAWMSNFVEQSRLFGRRPVVVNNMNIPPVPAGQPVLLSFAQVNTMFHEFGHGLHGLLADAQYPYLSGTATPPDFVEYPSQFNEMWAVEPAVLAHYARHHQTGAPMPAALFDKVVAAQTHGGGYATLEYVQAAWIDMQWHALAPGKAPDAAGVAGFEAAALAASGLAFAPVPPRYHTPYFSHVFAGGGYEAGYYAYLWSEVLARDTGAWFHANGGLTRANGDRFRALVLSRGRTVEPDVMFQEFYGKPPDVQPLITWRGLE